MAYKDFSAGYDGFSKASETHNHEIKVHIDGQTAQLPDASFVRDAEITRDGVDLVLKGPNGVVVIEGYFTAEPAPSLVAPDGSTLTPQLVHSFTHGSEFAANNVASDVSPVGAVQEVTGHATVQRADGSVETIIKGTPIFEGDVVTTDAQGAVNIMFVDQTTFAVSEDARLAIDNYVYDPSTQSGTTDFSILKGVFVFTSGLIGRDDPDDVKIQTPAGSIGIRGTIIAGNIHTGEITVVEGAIVLHDLQGHETTLASQFETARFNPSGGIEHMGQLSANDVSSRFSSVSTVSPNLFSSIHDAAHDAPAGHNADHTAAPAEGDAKPAPAGDQPHDAPNGPAPGEDHSAAPQGQAPVTAEGQMPAADHGPAVPPPPMNSVNGSGFGSSSGFEAAGTTFSSQPAAAANLPPPPPSGANFAPPPPPPPPAGSNTAGNTTIVPPPQTVPPVTGPVNHAPFSFFDAPPEFFTAAKGNLGGQTWHYSFQNAFGDLDFKTGDHLTFQLDTVTVNTLNSLTYDAGGPSPDVLKVAAGIGLDTVIGDEGHGWSFDSNTGQLDIFISNVFDTTQVPYGSNYGIDIGVRAIDMHGDVSAFEHYNFKAYNANPGDYLFSTFATNNQDNTVFTSYNGPAFGTIEGENNTIIFEQNWDHLLIFDKVSASDLGSNNHVRLGDGNNTIYIENDAFDNHIVAGNGEDSFIPKNGHVSLYGMGGDDRFVIDFANAPTLITDLTTSGTNTVMDGGRSGFRAAHLLQTVYGLNTEGDPSGRGDTLELSGNGTLNFAAINAAGNKISGIERIDMSQAGAQTVILNYDDVLKLSDGTHSRTLLINMGSGDHLDLVGTQMNIANMHKVLDDVAIDDGPNSAPNVQNFDVFSDGHVTLLVHNQGGGAIVTFDGTPVTV